MDTCGTVEGLLNRMTFSSVADQDAIAKEIADTCLSAPPKRMAAGDWAGVCEQFRFAVADKQSVIAGAAASALSAAALTDAKFTFPLHSEPAPTAEEHSTTNSESMTVGDDTNATSSPLPAASSAPRDFLHALVMGIDAFSSNAETVYHIVDLCVTLSADSGDVRGVLGRHGIAGPLIRAAPKHPKNGDVLFAVAFGLSTLTMADVMNGRRVLEAGGMQTLTEVFKASRRMANPTRAAAVAARPAGSAASRPGSSAGARPGSSSGLRPGSSIGLRPGSSAGARPGSSLVLGPRPATSSTVSAIPVVDKDLLADIEKAAKQALLNLMKVPFDVADEALAACNFGRFGDDLAVDELKWALQADRKNVNQYLKHLREKKILV